MSAGLVWASRQRNIADLRRSALDSIPNGALVVASADLDALRASPSFAPLLKEGRDIPGLGKVREVCGFDPMDTLHEIAVAIPAAGEEGEFGVVAAGEIDDEALVACASKVIEARGGRPTVTPVGSFQSVRDATLAATGGEIAVRKGGPVLLGAGAYLRAMVDAADGRSPTIRSSVAHTHLTREIGRATLRITVVLTPEQRRTLEAELAGRAKTNPPGGAVVAGALGVEVSGPDVSLRALLLCEGEGACASIAGSLRDARDEKARDLGARLMGAGGALERIQIEAEGEQIHARLTMPATEVIQLAERLFTMRDVRRPPPSPPQVERGDDAGAAAPDEIVTPAPTTAPTASAVPRAPPSPAPSH